MDEIEEARDYVRSNVLEPALSSLAVPESIKNTIRHSMTWLGRFKRTGDLVAYIDRFQDPSNSEVFNALKAAELLTFEDIRPGFLAKFGHLSDDTTRLDDFVVGRDYSSSDLVIFAKTYNNLGGGILPIGHVGKHQAVFIKATLEGGPYSNQWLVDGFELKYFLKSRKGNFKETYSENSAIIQFPNVPVYAFVRLDKKDRFILAGVFKSNRVVTESNGQKWFHLIRRDAEPAIDVQKLESDFILRVQLARNDSGEARRARLAAAPNLPAKIVVIGTAFIRNPDVVTEVLDRAKGVCEACHSPAPFERLSNGTPYLEVHHKLPLAQGGFDTVENAVALCPNCHRQEHYGNAHWQK